MAELSTIPVECQRCGELDVAVSEVRRTPIDSGVGMFVFTCPICRREVWQAADAGTLLQLKSSGVSPLAGTAPLELVEPHLGPAISWDELLEAHEQIDGHCCPQDELIA